MSKSQLAIIRDVAEEVLKCFEPSVDKKDGSPDCGCGPCENYRRAKKLVEAIGGKDND